jgi:CRP/FNR family cyclic AMP-dependent transcriptional regulator
MDGLGNIWFLEEVNLFEYFCPIKKADETYEKYPKRSYPKGEFIYFSDDSSDKVFFIHSGAVKIAGYTEEGDEVIKAVLHAGEVFGEMAMFGEARRTDYAKAMEPTELCVLARDQVANLMTEVSGFRNFIMGLMGKRVVYTQKRVESLLFKDAKTRIVEYILEQGRRNGKQVSQGIRVRNHLTHQEIANYTGTSRQTVTTILNQLREENLIDFDRKAFLLKDQQGLKAEAGLM